MIKMAKDSHRSCVRQVLQKGMELLVVESAEAVERCEGQQWSEMAGRRPVEKCWPSREYLVGGATSIV
jgi:hypothetical protein